MPIASMKAIIVSQGATPIEWNTTNLVTKTSASSASSGTGAAVAKSPVCIPNLSPRFVPTVTSDIFNTVNVSASSSVDAAATGVKPKKPKTPADKTVEAFSTTTGDVLRVFPTVKDAALAFNLSQNAIIDTCKGKKDNLGYVGWRFHSGPEVNCKSALALK